MKRTLSSLVSILCLLAFLVSSAACLAVALPQQAQTSSGTSLQAHTMGSPDHACCPGRAPSGSQMSNACCTVHHQPASSASTEESQQPGIPSSASSLLLSLSGVAAPAHADLRPAPLQKPPLIALRI